MIPALPVSAESYLVLLERVDDLDLLRHAAAINTSLLKNSKNIRVFDTNDL